MDRITVNTERPYDVVVGAGASRLLTDVAGGRRVALKGIRKNVPERVENPWGSVDRRGRVGLDEFSVGGAPARHRAGRPGPCDGRDDSGQSSGHDPGRGARVSNKFSPGIEMG